MINRLRSLFSSQRYQAVWLSICLPFYFLVLNTLFTSLYDTIDDQTLRSFFHIPFVSLCVIFINTLSPTEQAIAAQHFIISNHVNMEFVRTCDGSNPFFLLMSAILAFRSTLKLTVIGVLLGLVLIMAINLMRIVALYFLIHYNYVWFSYLHSTIAPFLLLSISCAYFAFWAYFANEVKCGRT